MFPSRTAASIPALVSFASLLFLPPALGGEGGKVILTEGSVWRTHITWKRAQEWDGTAVKEASIWSPIPANSPPPPEGWAAADFDDSSWGLWRETYPAENLKTKDGKDAGVRLYEYRQYGIQMSAEMGVRCLRGRFIVEDPAGARGLSLSVAYRGGVVVYLNGKEVGRAHVPKGERDGPAEPYPEEIYSGPDGKPWRLVNNEGPIPGDPETLKKFNLRIRELKLDLDAKDLRKGVNVLALSLHRAPYSAKTKAADRNIAWNTCGLAALELRADGAILPATERPKGLQVWSANALGKVGPFGNVCTGRIGQGAGVVIYNFPQSWAEAGAPIAPIRIVGTRNGVFSGQVVVSSDSPIRGLKASVGDLVQKGGAGKLPASAAQVCFMGFPDSPPVDLRSPETSLLDVLYEKPPAEVAILSEKRPGHFGIARGAASSWNDSGAVMPVWLKVRIPKDAPAGEYEGTLTVGAEGLAPVAVPVRLKVHEFVLPEPKDFFAHVGLVHSPETLAYKYKVPMWSDAHFALVEKTLSRMEELGGDAAFVPLARDTWPCSHETVVRWVKDGAGYKYDFAVFDRYLDLVQKHLKPEVVCLNVLSLYQERGGTSVSLLGGSGKVEVLPAPPDKDGAVTPEAAAFWKPVVAEAMERLKKRGLADKVVLGTITECGRYSPKATAQFMELFKPILPEGRWADLAHYAASKADINGVRFGYAMSVWHNKTPFKSKSGFGCRDLPLVLVEHYRADPVIDLRPTAHRGSLLFATEAALWETNGIGPIGMDFWNFKRDEIGPRSGAGSLEAGVTNLRMSDFSTAALLAPGPEGPLTTARFEIFRQGLQMCEARAVVERAVKDPAAKAKLPADLVKRYEDFNKENGAAWAYMVAGERFAQGEGWKWFETSGWEERTGQLFAIAAEVARATGK